MPRTATDAGVAARSRVAREFGTDGPEAVTPGPEAATPVALPFGRNRTDPVRDSLNRTLDRIGGMFPIDAS